MDFIFQTNASPTISSILKADHHNQPDMSVVKSRTENVAFSAVNVHDMTKDGTVLVQVIVFFFYNRQY